MAIDPEVERMTKNVYLDLKVIVNNTLNDDPCKPYAIECVIEALCNMLGSIVISLDLTNVQKLDLTEEITTRIKRSALMYTASHKDKKC